MTIERPDLSQVSGEVKAYIEALERELRRLTDPGQSVGKSAESDQADEVPLDPSEPTTTFNVVTMSRKGIIKRTPRHLYSRQRRGGMGVFDLELPDSDAPNALIIANVDQSLLLITDQARAFRLPLRQLPETLVRSRGQALAQWLALKPDERVKLALPVRPNGYVNLVTGRGHVRRFRYHIFKETMSPGTVLYDVHELGFPAAACWGSGEADLIIATRQGRAIRFAELQVSTRGCLGIRLAGDDQIISIAAVTDESDVFLLSADGKGIRRRMSGFSPNKAPGSGGKLAFKTDQLVATLAVEPDSDLFIISRLSKIIRFQAAEVSGTEGVVQGVSCIALRADKAVAATGSV